MLREKATITLQMWRWYAYPAWNVALLAVFTSQIITMAGALSLATVPGSRDQWPDLTRL